MDEKKTDEVESLEGIQGAQGQEVKEAPPVVDVEDTNRAGDKESAQNSDVIAIEQEKDAPEGEPVKPSFFVDKNENHRVEVDILTRKTDGRVVSVARTGLGLDYAMFDKLYRSEEWFEFTMPDYDAMSNYRQKSAVYRREAQQMLVDKIQLRNYLLVWHLKDWSMRDGDGNPVELTFDEDGSLSEKAIGKVYEMHATILDVVLTVFEKDLLLT